MLPLPRRWLLLLFGFPIGTRLGAQVPGLPISYHPVMQGIGAAVDVGVDTAGLRTVALTGTVALGTVRVGPGRLPLLSVSATGSLAAGGDVADPGWAAGVSVSLLNSFALGVGYSRSAGTARIFIPLSAALPVVQCISSGNSFVLYGTPAWNFEHVAGQDGAGWRSSWASVSAGALFQWRSGVGVQLLAAKPFGEAAERDPYRRLVFAAQLSLTSQGVSREALRESYGCHALL